VGPGHERAGWERLSFSRRPARAGRPSPGAMAPLVHDVPIVGIFTTAFVDGFTGLIFQPPTEEEIKEAFGKADARRAGKLDKTGVADAIRNLDKSERQVQKIVDAMEEEETDFEGFKNMVAPGPHPWSWQLGGVLPLPNHEKILDTPVLGNVLATTNEALAVPVDNTLRNWRRITYPPADHHMKMIFAQADADHSGRLDKSEVPVAMRNYFKTEWEIKNTLDELTNDICLYEFKKMIRGPKYSPSVVNYVPMVGPALATNLLSAFDDDVPEDDQQEAFEYLDQSKNGMLDKSEIADLFRELGKSELEVQKLVDDLPAEELDFKAFKEFMAEARSRNYLTSLSGYPVPNPAKVHDLPLIGTCTQLTQDIVVDTYQWTAGAAYKLLGKTEDADLRKAFDELQKDRSGKISKKECAKGLRALGLSERDIKYMRENLELDPMTFDEFKTYVTTGAVATPAAEGGKLTA